MRVAREWHHEHASCAGHDGGGRPPHVILLPFVTGLQISTTCCGGRAVQSALHQGGAPLPQGGFRIRRNQQVGGGPPPPDQRDRRGKTQNVQLGKSGRALFGTQTFRSQTPFPFPPPLKWIDRHGRGRPGEIGSGQEPCWGRRSLPHSRSWAPHEGHSSSESAKPKYQGSKDEEVGRLLGRDMGPTPPANPPGLAPAASAMRRRVLPVRPGAHSGVLDRRGRDRGRVCGAPAVRHRGASGGLWCARPRMPPAPGGGG